MIDWTIVMAQVMLAVVAAAAAERLRILCGRPILVGLLFGFLSLLAQCFPVAHIAYHDIAVTLHVAPPILAGFFFGPVTGLVAGGLAALSGVLALCEGAGALLVVCSVVGTLAASLYAVGIGRWVFGNRRPPVCTAVIAAAYGVVLALTVGGLFGREDLATMLEVVLASFVPLTVGTCLSVGLAALIRPGAASDRRSLGVAGFFSSLNLAFLFAGLAVTVTTIVIVLQAKDECETIVRQAVSDLVAEEESQARYMLHESAVNLSEALADLKHEPTREDLLRLASVLSVDGITLADSNGLVRVTTGDETVVGRPLERTPDRLRPYLDLCAGGTGFICQPYEPVGAHTNDWVKHFGYPLPGGGFLRLSYLWSKFQLKFPQYILPTLDGRTIGANGFYLVFNGRGLTEQAVSDNPETKGLSFAEAGLNEEMLNLPDESVFLARILGKLSRCESFERFGEYRLYAVLPLAETQGPALVIATIVALVLMIICVVFRLVLVRFQQAQEKIDALRAEQDRRRAADLAQAREIQRAELRTDGTEGVGYRLSTLMNAAREVGGDFYDYYELPDGRLVVTVADVSGKGIPAAFFMMKSRLTLKSCVFSSATLVEAVAKANRRLSANNPAEMFVTAWVGVYDRKTGVLDFVSAGHNPPLIRHFVTDATSASLPATWLQAPRSPAMGNFATARYRGAQVKLEAGDRLFLYTDGVNEAMNARGELFGNTRLQAVVAATEGPLVPAVRAAVDAFADGAEQADDITMLELVVGA